MIAELKDASPYSDITCTSLEDAILPHMHDVIAEAAQAIKDGKLVGMPTETVYGLAADACNRDAVLRIFAAKKRPAFDPLIVHVLDQSMAGSYAMVSDCARSLMDEFWPGPLTLVLPKSGSIPDEVSSGLDTIAMRCPNHPLALSLIKESGRPLAAPSANLFGRISPTTAEHVREQLGDAVACVIDGGSCAVGVESTVIAFDADDQVFILRPGGLSVDALSRHLAYTPVVKSFDTIVAEHLHSSSPGLLKVHYAPRIPMSIKSFDEPWPLGDDWGCLSYATQVPNVGCCEVLSSSKDINEAARALFAALRRLESAAVKKICAELVPDEGIGLAINDRLRRAAGQA